MKIFSQTKNLVKIEKQYTAKILQNLMIIEKDKLFCDLKYPSLFKYIIKELGHSEKEAIIRVNAVRLMLKSKSACRQIQNGKITLTNAAETNKVLQRLPKEQIKNSLVDKLVHEASTQSTRGFQRYVDVMFERERKETLILRLYMIEKFDRLRKKYGDLSTLELIEIILERELKSPRNTTIISKKAIIKSKAMTTAKTNNLWSASVEDAAVARRQPRWQEVKKSRYIAKSVKLAIYEGVCVNCGVMFNLEYDHKVKFSHGGSNSKDNIQVLCKSCNMRKEIVAKQSNFFA